MRHLKSAGLSIGWRGSLRLRLALGTLAWIFLSIAVAGWGVRSLFALHVSQQLEAGLKTHLEQLAANLAVDTAGAPTLRTPLSDPRLARPYSGLYWQIDRMDGPTGKAEPAILRSRSLWDVVLTVPDDALADGELHSHRVRGPGGDTLRMIEQVLHPAERPDEALRLIVAASERLVSEPVEAFHRPLVLALGVLALGLVLAVAIQVVIGLRPLARLRDELGEVRMGHQPAIVARYPSEIQPLVDEFNAVLARNAEIVERARTQAGNLAHAVKTPLAVLANAAAEETSSFATLVGEQVAAARTQVSHHLARARAAAAVQLPGQRCALEPVLQALVRVMEKVHAERGLTLALSPVPAGLAFRGEEQDLQEMLGNLIDNACKWARMRVTIAVQADATAFEIHIDDDGPGLAPAIRETVFARGMRADEHVPGSGLGLAIVRDLALLYGGDIALDASPSGGLRATLRLPRA